VPNSVLIWAIVGALAVFVLTRTTFGRSLYGIANQERAAYLSGINTRRILLIAFVSNDAAHAEALCKATSRPALPTGKDLGPARAIL
jgi:ribose transport system permease protein